MDATCVNIHAPSGGAREPLEHLLVRHSPQQGTHCSFPRRQGHAVAAVNRPAEKRRSSATHPADCEAPAALTKVECVGSMMHVLVLVGVSTKRLEQARFNRGKFCRRT